MAEENNFPPDRFRNRKNKRLENDNSDSEEPIKLDLGIDPSKNYDRNSDIEEAAAGSSVYENSRRDDNPFSFKHFLCSDMPIYQTQGARPKVYCDGRPISSISDLDLHNSSNMKQTRIVPEFSAALPDFVQDHLVVEQCYLDKDNHDTFNAPGPNLPDFTPSNSRNSLNGNVNRNFGRPNDPTLNVSMPLDLPVKPLVEFPLDLPILDSQPIGSRSCPLSAEVGSSKSLPDFLTDGAVRTQSNEDDQSDSSPESEINRLRHENELYRQQIAEQSRRCEHLQRRIDAENKYTEILSTTIGHVEERWEYSNKRAATAESLVTKLKQEMISLKNEINRLQKENKILLQGEQGAAGGPCVSTLDTHSTRLAQELRTSANTAEHSLRQLLTGVDNLRIIASTIENFNRIQEKNETFSDAEDNTGPAL